MKLLLTTLLCLAIHGPLQAGIRWGESFNEMYHSEAVGAEVAFRVQTPPEIEGLEAYPLVVVLNGGPRVPPSEQFPHFRAQPSRAGIWGYRAISTFDAMQVIGSVKGVEEFGQLFEVRFARDVEA